MSQQNVEVVRQPVAVRARSRRHLEERLALRFPRVFPLASHAVFRLPPRSRMRQALLRRVVRLAYEATNRNDYEAAFVLWHPNVELIPPSGYESLGTSGIRGRDERVRFQRKWDADWGAVRYEPEEIIDLGPRVLVIARIKGIGLSSGAAVESEWANLVTISSSDGGVIREQAFTDHREALEAVGLRE